MTLYRNIIKKSWKMTWHNKYLWFFGLFAVLLGNGGEYELFFRSLENNQQTESLWVGFISQLNLNFHSLVNIGKRFWENPSLTFVILLTYIFIVLIFLFVFWMMNVSQIAIVNATAMDSKEKKHNMSLGLRKGIRHFWPVFSLNLAVKILIVFSLALLALLKGTFAHIALFLVIIPLVMSVLFIAKYSVAYIVIRKEKVFKALVLAWNLFWKNWIISLELAIILYVFTIIAALLFMFLSFNIAMFFQVLARLVLVNNPGLSFSIFYSMMPLVLFLVLAFIGSLLTVFQTGTWTKLFLELDSRGAQSKIERIFSK